MVLNDLSPYGLKYLKLNEGKLFFCDNLKEVERLSSKINFQKSMPFNYDLKSISSSINK